MPKKATSEQIEAYLNNLPNHKTKTVHANPRINKMRSKLFASSESRGATGQLSFGAGLITTLLQKDFLVNVQELIKVATTSTDIGQVYQAAQQAQLIAQGINYGLIGGILIWMYSIYGRYNDGRVVAKGGDKRG